MSRDIDIFGLKTAGGSSSAFPISLNVDNEVKASGMEIGIGRTTNPTAVADASEVRAFSDDVGRPVVWPYQVRDLISTGFATLTRISETTILAGVAATFLDVVQFTGINNTGVAVRVDIRDSAGGGIVDALIIPANDIRTKQYNVPLPQNEAANSWTGTWSNSTGEISDSPVIVAVEAVRNV